MQATVSRLDFDHLRHEHQALALQYGRVQTRCSQLVAAQAKEIAHLQTLVFRLRATAMVKATTMAFAVEDAALLERSARDADLVICQTGCVNHQDHWRSQDDCRRTGKQCVLVQQPEALNRVRSRRADTTATTAPPPKCPASPAM